MQIDVQKCSNFDMQQQQRQRHRWQKCNQARHFERPRQTHNTKQQKTVADNGQQKQRERERGRDSADRQLRVTISNDMNEPVFAGT